MGHTVASQRITLDIIMEELRSFARALRKEFLQILSCEDEHLNLRLLFHVLLAVRQPLSALLLRYRKISGC